MKIILRNIPSTEGRAYLCAICGLRTIVEVRRVIAPDFGDNLQNVPDQQNCDFNEYSDPEIKGDGKLFKERLDQPWTKDVGGEIVLEGPFLVGGVCGRCADKPIAKRFGSLIESE